MMNWKKRWPLIEFWSAQANINAGIKRPVPDDEQVDRVPHRLVEIAVVPEDAGVPCSGPFRITMTAPVGAKTVENGRRQRQKDEKSYTE
ncbi:MAG: hypothetical protein R2843_10675 [Thermomicrobiales bacterium]